MQYNYTFTFIKNLYFEVSCRLSCPVLRQRMLMSRDVMSTHGAEDCPVQGTQLQDDFAPSKLGTKE